MNNLFLNFDVNSGFSINTFRKANTVSCEHGDLGDFLADAQKKVNSSVSIYLMGAFELLENGNYWQNSDIEDDTLEHLHKTLKEYQIVNGEA